MTAGAWIIIAVALLLALWRYLEQRGKMSECEGKERVQLSAEELRVLLVLTLESIRGRNEINPETVLLGAVLVKLGRALVRALPPSTTPR
ncbi:hypothetical protein ES703_116250 [subsurface metagenome]